MLNFIMYFNLTIFILFTLCYSYQLYYVAYVLWSRKKPLPFADAEVKLHRYAFVTSARNESNVIAELIESIQAQDYPKELIDIYVIADNCTDNTAEIARSCGAKVYERFNTQLIGKGYALDEFFGYIHREMPAHTYDGFFIFDADNLLDPQYTRAMNRVFDQGYRVVTSYRNSRNYGSNWISAGYALWFLRESKYLSKARMLLGTSCAISGTGFLVSDEVICANGGWPYHLLTEDIQFSIANIIKGETIGYADDAIIYDEQPITFKQSWNQRLRWSKGFYQVLINYGTSLVKGIFKGSKQNNHPFACFDMLMTIVPAVFLALLSIVVNGLILLTELNHVYVVQQIVDVTQQAVLFSCFNFYFMLFVLGVITTITEWEQIDAPVSKKVLYVFSFPIFILTYIPISFVALFKQVQWTPIAHGLASAKTSPVQQKS